MVKIITNKPILPTVVAERDIEDAIVYYERESQALALSFIEDLEKGIIYISEHPASGSTRYAYELEIPHLRSWWLIRFPYLVFYTEREDHISIWRVLHAHSDVPSWMQK